MSRESQMINKLIEIDKQMKKEKPFLFEKFEIVYSKRFETLDEALEFYEKEKGLKIV